MQLANEKRVWHEVRERQRPAASSHLRTSSWEERILDSRGVARQEKMEEEVHLGGYKSLGDLTCSVLEGSIRGRALSKPRRS